MSELFNKLNYKGQKAIWILNSPASFARELSFFEGVDISKELTPGDDPAFLLVFVEKKDVLDVLSKLVIQQVKNDPVLWFAYPKGSSKKYQCDFNRDTGWDILLNAGFRPVRQVSIDADWSALRFRRAEYIKLKK